MALADYYLCDICESKCFYDANLNWEWSEKDDPIPEDEMVRGKHLRLGYCGDMAAICLDCAKTHEVKVVELSPKPPVQDSCVRCGEETVCGKTHCEACCYEPISAPATAQGVNQQLREALAALIADYDVEYITSRPSSMLDGLLAKINYAREAIAQSQEGK